MIETDYKPKGVCSINIHVCLSDDGKTVYLMLSKWYNYVDSRDPTGYNVRVLSFTLN